MGFLLLGWPPRFAPFCGASLDGILPKGASEGVLWTFGQNDREVSFTAFANLCHLKSGFHPVKRDGILIPTANLPSLCSVSSVGMEVALTGIEPVFQP
jgi:hypothetical protein